MSGSSFSLATGHFTMNTIVLIDHIWMYPFTIVYVHAIFGLSQQAQILSGY
jgi:hypothetical protein